MAYRYKLALIGCGQMGAAILKGLLNKDFLSSEEIIIYDPAKKDDYLSVKMASDLKEALSEAENILLAIKPQQVSVLENDFKEFLKDEQLLISIIAGLETLFWEGFSNNKTQAVLRAMPNTPCLLGEGFIGICRGQHITEAQYLWGEQLFKSVGQVVEIKEDLMHPLSALSGAGPAYVFSFLEALSEGGVMLGLDPDVATAAAVQTLLGSVLLYRHEKEINKANNWPKASLAELRKQVTSAGGVTARGLYALEKGSFKYTVMKALEKADQKSRAMGKLEKD